MIDTLVVDDDFRVAETHRAYVEAVPGFRVVGVAHTAASALAAVRRSEPRLLLLDLYLPDRNGLALLADLRGRERAAVDVIVVTAAHDADKVEHAMRYGGLLYVVKPFPFEVLRDKLVAYRSMRRQLDVRAHVDQDQVDALYAALRTAAAPKSLAGPTLDAVAAALRGAAGDLSAAELGDQVGVSRATAQRYLVTLVRQEKAEIVLRYGHSGRPEHGYRWVGSR